MQLERESSRKRKKYQATLKERERDKEMQTDISIVFPFFYCAEKRSMRPAIVEKEELIIFLFVPPAPIGNYSHSGATKRDRGI